MTRGLSTVLDVSLFLLFVGAAVATVTVAATPSPDGPVDDEDPADETVEVLATSTVRVNYSLGPALAAAGHVDPGASGQPIFDRSAHGSYAELLGEAAVANATVDGEPVTVGRRAFETAVANLTDRAIRQRSVQTSVRAIWTPYPDAPLKGMVRTGEQPPRDGDVHTATVVVDSGVPSARRDAIEAAPRDGFGGVASVLAAATVEGLFPPRETRAAVRGDYPTNEHTIARYQRAAHALGSEGPPEIVEGPDRANATLRSAARDSFASDLRDRYDDARVAARDVEIDRVTVVVRTWSR